MKITRENYEPFFLDFLEGNLVENKIDQFLDFLEQNPGLKEELQLFENVHIPEESIVYPEREKLYKSAVDEKEVAGKRMVAYLEGDLKDDDRKSFEAWIATNPELKNEYELYNKTRLVPNSAIQYPGKNKLYRKSGKAIVLNRVARAAAVVILLWGINSVYNNQNETFQPNVGHKIAEVTPKTKPEPPVKQNDSEKKAPETEVLVKPKQEKETKPAKTKSIREKTKGRLEEKKSVEPKSVEKDLTAFVVLPMRNAQLEKSDEEIQLAVSVRMENSPLKNGSKVMSVDEFLASRAKRVGDEGFLSAKRIARAGLGLVSELSGDMIGYGEKDGKITSVEFESKLMAFSIPFKK
ncbi:MAG: hypothetical protein WC384_15425 [Prolixibacteraceae bacterium]|jgi:hypothetical protein